MKIKLMKAALVFNISASILLIYVGDYPSAFLIIVGTALGNISLHLMKEGK